MLLTKSLGNRVFYVAKTGCDKNDGSKANPFLTIQMAAEVARPGDTVTVHAGEYREWVKPRWGGISNRKRITYQAAEGEKVVIKGSEIVKDWEQVEGSVYKAVVPNTVFGDFNPFATVIFGDWFLDPNPADRFVHYGDVYLNGKSFYEAESLDAVKNPKKREFGFNPFWTKKPEPILEPEQTVYQWFAEVDDANTAIYANFHGFDPNNELVEISVRKSVFYPETMGKHFITVRGFELCQATGVYAPPSGDQPGLIGPHWSKGWVIEDNRIYDCKCSGVSLGKEATTGDNLCTRTQRKPGYQYQMESVFRALELGWNKENVGSHVVRRNEIYDCGQNGIVGHLGCAFSEIYENHIYNIAVKHEYYGYEIGGIKFHAPIDTVIRNNNFHNCTMGVWLDWQVQGTRISNNLFYNNDRDLFIEVTHGPHTVDNNILGSAYSLDNIAQGGAYINNLVCGTMRREPVLDRSTPYHLPHSTTPLGTAVVYGGDDRWFQNIFVGVDKIYTEQSKSGTDYYDGSPASLEEYIQRVIDAGNSDIEKFRPILDPVYINHNAYLKGAKAYDKEETKFISAVDPGFKVVKENGQTFVELSIEKGVLDLETRIVETADLEDVRIVEAAFENPDGSPIVFDVDYTGAKRTEVTVNVGPFAGLVEGKNKIKVWG
ncbi:MAG: right-handed parallel beta-helix repeat-containing protein [Lachnospiraceae bacterium]|nr:right-handed parallel beta-helix repeat-containing protein [Lachnospiraceae bacterium]